MSGYYPSQTDLSMMSHEEVMASLASSSTGNTAIPAIYGPGAASLPQSAPTFSPPYAPVQYLPQTTYAPYSQTSYTGQQIWSSPPPSADSQQLAFPPSDPAFSFPRSHHQYHDNGLGLSPELHTRASRSPSFTSAGVYTAKSSPDPQRSDYSRSVSPSSGDLRQYGYLNKQGTWSCAYPACTSRAVFTRGCDLRKHHKRHTKSFFCRHEGCPQARGGGFSSKKDLARHEAKHNPGVLCEWEGCERVFSRVDNMRDHVKRIHLKAAKQEELTRAVAKLRMFGSTPHFQPQSICGMFLNAAPKRL
ncbi:hypothetical protein P152DRAFT_452415 [Eremomyces bilateralis CBS 781.70]|uniref:C2H2-type domain-containing protein n=1 Tax=Eremomyces bilateralis CBS 781.70 TaxID=1392243 RepID=A0A6G1FT61_9PEZI|nr:uncharacterized protein P152DRAFT_452415 [Eremomyces bilateralis CBS 781.70]KAF1808920.1 hypothetical protein P152DRAFT_452415 [Eremomyces bilateralis CBS 781.70]